MSGDSDVFAVLNAATYTQYKSKIGRDELIAWLLGHAIF